MVTAQLTEYGATITGYPVGTLFSWDEAKELPVGVPDKGLYVANWYFEKPQSNDSVVEPVRIHAATVSRLKGSHSEFYDNQLDVNAVYRDHTKASYPTLTPYSEVEALVNAIVLPASKQSKLRNTDWRKPVFDAVKRHGDFAPHMVRAFTNILELKDYTTALSMIKEADERLRENRVRYCRNDDEIVELAKAKSKAFARILANIFDESQKIEKAESLLSDIGLALPEYLVKRAEKSGDFEPIFKRVTCDVWLRRQLRRVYFAHVEAVARDLLLINSNQNPYCSAHSVRVIRSRQMANEQAMINTVAFNEEDPEIWFTLHELAAKSISNPVIRRAEMFVRLKAFDEIAVESNHSANFLTVTAPSRFHVYSGDEINPNWIDAGRPTAKDGHAHIMNVLGNWRKALDKEDIKFYGLRVVEPHQDGTPHAHLLVFCEKQHEKRVIDALRSAALGDSPKEKGAKKYRFKCEPIDRKKGGAVSYVAKYLSKNIDGKHIQQDKDSNLSGEDASSSVVSFNKISGIRQFQFHGGPSITAWREMRRFREEFKEDDAVILGNNFSKDEHFVLETIRKAADDGDFKAFVIAMGGVLVKRNEQTLRVDYVKKIDVAGMFKQTRYGEEMAAAIQGVLFQGKSIRTRFGSWKFANKKMFVKGMRHIMQGTKYVFNSLEEELEYHAMMQDEYERMAEEAAILFEHQTQQATAMLYAGEVFTTDAPPPEFLPSWAQPDWGDAPEALDLWQ